ncbi:siderophore-interacting protein [Arthrobacter mangrovi]|uniref:Siderophore-interacting protein n=1 Tax=Arthrobacter mangrovi TaxID=2966350 RepID=A0ABQ5MZW0_9MICC|nr:siderophore-interacting protein [Arthrobacter mangrovi]GLB69522.1 siderophore-interacting protein [Arthrobacter mangrovi]
MSSQPAAPARTRKPQINLRVTRTERLSEHMVRVFAGGEGFAKFEPKPATDQYVKIWFLPPDLDVELPANVAELKESLPADRLPVSRTYTVRSVDTEAGELAIDFVVHGDEGVAGPWAASARAGDWLMLTGPGGAYSPAPAADWYLFAGDDAALPAVAAAIDALPPSAAGHVFLEVDSPADVQELGTPHGVEVHWLYRQGRPAGTTSLLRDAVAELDWPAGDVDAFVHGERGAVKELRDVLFKDHGLHRKQVSISGYWAYGRAEDAFQAEKKTPTGQIFPENYPG